MKDRADKVLVDQGLVATRSQAKSLIEKGDVLCDGVVLTKAGELIAVDAKLEIKSPIYVGRGAFKLEKALTDFKIDVKDLILLDIGASTGGFTEVLLLNGAKKVYAIDVGRDQLAQKIKEDERVVNLEGFNIKDISSLPDVAHGAVMDLSFISITKVLDQVANLLVPGGFLVALVKPQFEAGPERLPKDGVIKDAKVQQTILEEVVYAAITKGWALKGKIDSPIEGKAGNKEFLIYLLKT